MENSVNNEVIGNVSSKPPKKVGTKGIVLAVVLVLAVAGVIGVVILNGNTSKKGDEEKQSNDNSGSSDKTSVDGDDLLILIQDSEGYGYIDSKGVLTVDTVYKSAREFTDKYTVVKTQDGVSQLLDLGGEVVMEGDIYNLGTSWVVNGVLYDRDLKQLSPQGMVVNGTGSYGYCSWVDEANRKAGIMKYDGTITYTYSFADDEKVEFGVEPTDGATHEKVRYCVTNHNEKHGIVNCESGVVVYPDSNAYISVHGNNVFEIGHKYVFVRNDQILYQNDDENIEVSFFGEDYVKLMDKTKVGQDSISYFNFTTKETTSEMPDLPYVPDDGLDDSYEVYKCGDDLVSLRKDGKDLTKCEWSSFSGLSESTAERVNKATGHEYVIATKSGKEVDILEVDTGKVVMKFDYMLGSYMHGGYSSSFMYMDANGGGVMVFNILTGKSLKIDDGTVELGYSYICVYKDNVRTYYNQHLEKIYTIEL